MGHIAQIKAAREAIAKIAHETPLDYSQTFSDLAANDMYLKLENLQKTGSFKVRGAYNKIHSLQPKDKQKGVIAASAGNHAQGVAFAATQENIASTIVMPEGAPLAKLQATEAYGAEIVQHGSTFDEALERAIELHRETGATFIHAFDDEKIIAGQGTIGLEIVEQLPEVDAIVCPIGGGGLISGIAKAVKELKPSVKVYGVEAAACVSMGASLKEGKPLKVRATSTIADGIAVKQPGRRTLDLVQKYVDDVFVVDDLEISRTMLYLLERNKLLVEGSGAAALAAMLYHKIPETGKKVVSIVSGGNVDILFISRIIQHGLVEAGRFVTFTTLVNDKPGNLNRLLTIVAKHHANVISIQHHRITPRIIPGQTEIELALETKNDAHIAEVKHALKEAGYTITKKI
ncbi:threonine ammonia-lyase [Numidum massiliense]|uniref:threonine ammonia-lyase n=1 Tax=Numidum massiliense TaxID=1522315 RepID=UPI0006D57107|nr:threonine ammonia-lyase [Numidum massiliense]